MKHELDKMMDLIEDYKTGYGGVTDSFIRKELEMFAFALGIMVANMRSKFYL